MELKPDQRYNGVVVPGSHLFESNNGTSGYKVLLETEDGEIKTSFTIWLTEKNRDRAIKYFAVLGVPEAKLRDENYLEYELANAISGKEVAFGASENFYKDTVTVQVSWIGKRSNPNLSKSTAQFFAGKTDAPPHTDADRPVEEEEDSIPF